MKHRRPPITGTPKRVISIKSKHKKDSISPLRVDLLSAKEKPIILIKRLLGGLGDVLMTTPMLKAIKKLLPHCHLVYATDLVYSNGGLKEIIEHCPYVDEIISAAEANSYSCDYSVDVTATGLIRERSGTIPPNRIDMFAEAAGLTVADDPVPIYIINQSEEELIRNEFSNLFNTGSIVIGIQTRSNDSRRTWPEENLKELVTLLLERTNYKIALLDWGHTAKEWEAYCEQSDRLTAFTERTLTETAAFVNLCDLIVCPDSSTLHLAGALNKKIVSIFGPIPYQSRINHYQNAMAIQLSSCKYLYCWYSPKCSHNSPTNSKLSCLKNITGEMVFNAILKKLKEEEKNYMIDKPSKQDKILVKRSARGLGDMLMAQTGIEALKAKYPSKKIYVYAPLETHVILKNNPNVDKLIDSNVERINYSDYCLVYDITSPCAKYETARNKLNKPVEKNRVEIYAEAMGVRNLIKDLLPRYYPSKEEIKYICSKVKLDDSKKTIVLAPFSAELYRNWPQENFINLINLIKDDFNVVIQSNEPIEDVININIDEYTVRDLGALISISDLVVTVDSAPLHIAAALGKPTIALFGPIDYKARCRGYKNITVVKSNHDCIPCWRNATIKCKINNSIELPSECLKSISGKQIYKIIKDILIKENNK